MAVLQNNRSNEQVILLGDHQWFAGYSFRRHRRIVFWKQFASDNLRDTWRTMGLWKP